MKNNKKTILLILITITTLILLSTASATTDTNTTTTTSSISEKTTTTEPVVKEVQKQEKTPEKQATKNKEKIIKENKTEKQTKKDSITIEVTDGTSFSNAINSLRDTVHDEGIIELTEGTYDMTSKIISSQGKTKKVIINGNNQQITNVNSIQVANNNELILNNLNSDNTNRIYNRGGTITINNCNINLTNTFVQFAGTTIIDDNTKISFSDSTTVTYKAGTVFTNDPILISKLKEAGATDEDIQPYGSETITNKTIENTNITTPQIYAGIYTLINCQINAKIINNGNLTLQNCSLSNNNIIDFLIENKGNFVINDCIVENNTGNGVVINSTGDLIFINSNVFNNTCAVISVPSTTEPISVDVRNNSFINNRGVVSIGKSVNSVVNIKENTFTNSSINSMFNQTNIEENTFTNTTISINNELMNATNKINSNVFYNTIVISPFLTAYNNTFNGGRLSGSEQLVRQQCPVNYLEIYNNTFNNATLNIPCAIATSEGFSSSSSKETMMNNSIHNNIFNGKTSIENVITLTFPEWNENTKIFNNTYIQTSINDSMTYEISPKLFVNDNITFNYQLNNPKNYDEDILEKVTYDIYIDDILYKANTQDNTIQFNTNGEHTITIKPSISTTVFTRTVDVLKLSDIIITPDNYNKYISNGELTRVNEEDRVLFQGEFTDKGQIFIVTDDIVIDGRDAHFTNTTFTLEAQNVVIQNMNIENTNTNNPTISNTKRNNHILNNNITLINTEGKTTAIQSTAANTQIRNNIIYVDGPAPSIDHNTGGTANTQAILIIGSNKNTVQNNTITVTTTQESEQFGTIEGITATGVTNTIITQNRVNVSNAKFSYGINMLSNVTDNSITQNNITVTSYRYCDGIQVGNQATNIFIQENQINIYCHNTTPVDEEAISYGIIVINMQDGQLNTEIYIDNNNITIDSTVGYGIEIYKTNSTEIRSNTINVKGLYSMGIGFAHSPTPAVTASFLTTRVQANNITIFGDSTQKIRGVTEEIQPANIGIQIQQNSTNIKINDGYSWGHGSIGPNIIHTYDKGGQDYCINVESEGAKIGGNELVCSNGVGNKAIKNTTTMTLEYNAAGIIYTNIEMNLPSETIINTTIPITISLRDEYNKTIGQVWEYDVGTMTITLTIDNQNTTLNIKDETITYNYTPNNTGTIEITATFNGVLTYNATTTTKTLTVNPKPESHTNTTTENITLGETTTLTATFIDDNDQLITSGKVIFKVNGKTIRDNNGNVIYAEIIDGQATLPDVNITQEWMKPDTTIQAVYVGNDNNEPITTKPTTINVTKPEATIILDTPTEATAGTTITLKATVTDGENNINTGRVAFKLNGKTLKDPKTGKALYANVENGVATIQYTIPEKTKAKTYNLTVVFTDTAYDRKEASAELVVAKA